MNATINKTPLIHN